MFIVVLLALQSPAVVSKSGGLGYTTHQPFISGWSVLNGTFLLGGQSFSPVDQSTATQLRFNICVGSSVQETALSAQLSSPKLEENYSLCSASLSWEAFPIGNSV